MATDPYEVLGLNPGATRSEINRTYRRLAKLHHPDVNQGDKQAEERFKTIIEAYNQLTGKSPPPVEVRPPAGGDMTYVQELEARYRATRPAPKKLALSERLAGIFRKK